jgi:rhamnopyranosyl-N-acetylglucosaminyl-diphospho-decaprenol beta-1,3/1,4-galactofuranosyltransferase
VTSLSSIACIVVTRDRLELLKKCVAAVRAQTRCPDEIFIIDNASSDGSSEWLAAQKDLTVIRQDNLGSSGGQWRGIKEAFQKGHDWFWCMDDDTIPEPPALATMLACGEAKKQNTGFLCSFVRWRDGYPHAMNVPVINNRHDVYPLWADLNFRKTGVIPILSCSFVSVLVSRRAVVTVGLPLKEMFIWMDDVEFTGRISKKFMGYQVLQSVALHDTPQNLGVGLGDLTEASVFKFKHFLRNDTYLMLCDEPSVAMKLLLSARRFKRTIMMVQRKVGLKSSWELYKYFLWGFFFRPKVDFPNTSSGAAPTNQT